jgi:hypothetical protein
LASAVLTEEFLLLRLASIQFTTVDGSTFTISDFRRWLLPLGGGYVSVSELAAFFRGGR